jgi:hypothetical protein
MLFQGALGAPFAITVSPDGAKKWIRILKGIGLKSALY